MSKVSYPVYVGYRQSREGKSYLAMYVDMGYSIRNLLIDRNLICELCGCYVHEAQSKFSSPIQIATIVI